MTLPKTLSKKLKFNWVSKALESAGGIILITGAGGAFGNILRKTSIGDVIGNELIGFEIGVFLPFIIAALLKTAQVVFYCINYNNISDDTTTSGNVRFV